MKYYEIHEPYYALIAAEDEKKAAEVYVDFVADDDGNLKNEVKEVCARYALGTFVGSVAKTNPHFTLGKVATDFVDRKNGYLLIDSSLA
ncbi:hypothetical protein PJ311_18375 [Bacillus sp. CLL-7-23]|uniref:Uncharacterized protein n=1 Tax=Bacillus changyiensis TaxID=3004103 RepID=A0ABT4X8F4_9BACI|nr:hypothetical protein [Bacillus changyiensis]MDA1477284.1 hypothetical protein [Bacillus changyiensis]MDA7028508.1 hypothetical protein [Bacillus changyiensis]